MPRPNPTRSLQSETNLARRIAFEREERGWTYEGTAKRLTDAGCAIQSSAIYKIEKSDPPRRISVDELVGFAKVFDLSVEELLVPMELIHDQRAMEIIKEMQDAGATLAASTTQLRQAMVRYLDLGPDATKRADHLWSFNTKTITETVTADLDVELHKPIRTLVVHLIDAAKTNRSTETASEP